MRKILSLVILLLILGGGAWLVLDRPPTETAPTTEQAQARTENVATGLEVPWEAAWLPDGRTLVTERPGRVRVLENGELQDQPILTIEAAQDGEGGLQGLAIDPDYEQNKFVYLYVTEQSGGAFTNRVVRYVHDGNRLVESKILLDGIPGNTNHNGGRIAFGPDRYLYVATGDAEEPQSAQDRNGLSGKILRMDREGDAPPDNPFGNLTWSYGHRNPQGLAWDTDGTLYETEHGPTGEFGLCCRDELNRIERGGNYGWPVITGSQTRSGMLSPIATSGDSDTWAPGGIAFGPDGKLYAATLRGDHLRVFTLRDGQVTAQTELFANEFGRLRTATFGQDGKLYLLTSNRDGRGQVRTGDDRIIRVNGL